MKFNYDDWKFSDEALTHLLDCKYQEAPMDACDCQQRKLADKLNAVIKTIEAMRK